MTVINFDWDEVEDNIVAELDDEGNTVAQYTTESTLYGNVISQYRDGATSYFHHDGIGNTTEVTNDNGNVTDTRAYNAFGEITESTGTTEFPFQFVGQKGYYRDAETGEYSVRRRPYDPVIARWKSVDPLQFVDGMNVYQYVQNRATYHSDPSGSCSVPGLIWKHKTLRVVPFWAGSAVNPEAATRGGDVVDAIKFGEDVFDMLPDEVKPPIGVSPGIGASGKALAEKVKGLYGKAALKDGVRIWVKIQCRICEETWCVLPFYYNFWVYERDLPAVWYPCDAKGTDPVLSGGFSLQNEYGAIVKAFAGCVTEAWEKADCLKSGKLQLGTRDT